MSILNPTLTWPTMDDHGVPASRVVSIENGQDQTIETFRITSTDGQLSVEFGEHWEAEGVDGYDSMVHEAVTVGHRTTWESAGSPLWFDTAGQLLTYVAAWAARN